MGQDPGEVLCPYCGRLAVLTTGREIYPHRNDLHGHRFYVCRPCDAYVGCHRDTDPPQPYGRLANRDLRRERMAAHRKFDKLWRRPLMSRTEAYEWLAACLGIKKKDCHIGQFDEETCYKVLAVVDDVLDYPRRRRVGGMDGLPDGEKPEVYDDDDHPDAGQAPQDDRPREPADQRVGGHDERQVRRDGRGDDPPGGRDAGSGEGHPPVRGKWEYRG